MKLLSYMSGLMLMSATLLAAEDTLPVKGNVNLKPGEIHEACFPAKNPEKIRYQFNASGAINFNIHYHEGKKVSYPIKQNAVMSTQGIFTPSLPQFYCMMWQNIQKSAVNINFKAHKE